MDLNLTLHSKYVTHNNPTNEDAKKQTQTESLRIDGKQLNETLTAKEEIEEAESEIELPEHIKKIMEQIERLKERIELERKALAELKANQQMDDDVKEAMITMKLEMIAEMTTQKLDLMMQLTDALKEAGITDPGVLIRTLV